MRTKRVMWLAPLGVVLVVAAAVNMSAQPATAEREIQAIRGVFEKLVSTINDSSFQKAPAARRLEMLRPFYRAANSYAREEQPLFFGPLTEPISRGTDAHLENQNLNFEWVFKQGLQYGLRVDEMQVEVDRNLAAVLAVTTSGYASADNKTRYATRGRASVVMNKMGGRWLIAHEHLELFNPQNPNQPTKEKLTNDIQRMKPR